MDLKFLSLSLMVVVEKVSGLTLLLLGCGAQNSWWVASFPLYHYRPLTSQDGTGLADGHHTYIRAVLFLQIMCLMLLRVPVHSC